VKFVSVTNGDAGHQEMGAPLWRAAGTRKPRNRPAAWESTSTR
jgi:hypothetical protein